MVDPAQIEQRTELAKARGIEVGTTLGGVVIQTISDLEQISLRLARGMVAVPVHCRDQPGVCYALCMQALEWGMPIMSVINKSYVPRNGDRIGFESQLLHAVIEKNAPLKNRLRYDIIGEGDERRCKVYGTFKGEDKPHEYVSETLAKMHPGHVTKDNVRFVKGSPLWDSNPEVQMFYSASRQWARLFAPDVLLGAYTPEEMENAQPMLDVTPKVEGLAQRLRDAKAQHAEHRGFDHDHIVREGKAVIEGEANPGVVKQEATDGIEGHQDEPEGGERLDHAGDRTDDAPQSDGGEGGTGAVDADGTGTAADGADEAGQAETFPPDRKPRRAAPPKPRKR